MAKFEPPWRYAHHPGYAFVVKDATGRRMFAIDYSHDQVANPEALTRDEAELLAKWIVSTPERFAEAWKAEGAEPDGDRKRGVRGGQGGAQR